MSGKTFEDYRQNELNTINNDFKFSEILKSASNNMYWQSKTALWTVISGACNAAAKEFYIKMQNYVANIADIDTCNIHTLKSIAKSVDAEHLTNFISEDYPIELLELINLFSIKKDLLLKSNKLDYSAHYNIIMRRNRYITN